MGLNNGERIDAINFPKDMLDPADGWIGAVTASDVEYMAGYSGLRCETSGVVLLKERSISVVMFEFTIAINIMI